MIFKSLLLASLLGAPGTVSLAPQLPPAATIPTRKDARAVLVALQAAIRNNDRRAVGTLIAFPLSVRRRRLGSTYVGSPQVLMTTFPTAFSKRVREAVLAQDPDTITMKDGMFVVGRGELMIGVRCDSDDLRSCHTGVLEVWPYRE